MSTGKLEHVNLTVTDPQRSAQLFRDLCGWKIRWEGPAMMGGHTIHVGDETEYLALYTNPAAKSGAQMGGSLNHVGLLVTDLADAERTVSDAGLKSWGHDDYEPGRRFYFYDWDGIEFEVVSYE